MAWTHERPRGRECVRADAAVLPPCNFKKDATVHLSHGRPHGHRPIVRPSVRPSENVRVTTMDLARKKRREYDLDRHSQDHWAAKMSWVEAVIGASGKIIQISCKIYSEVEWREKLLVPKIDSLYKHVERQKTLASIEKIKAR
jgi:hypothetical protein